MDLGAGVCIGRGGGGGVLYREIGMERSGVGAGFETGQYLCLLGRGRGSDNVHSLVSVGSQNDVVVDVDRSIFLKQNDAAV